MSSTACSSNSSNSNVYYTDSNLLDSTLSPSSVATAVSSPLNRFASHSYLSKEEKVSTMALRRLNFLRCYADDVEIIKDPEDKYIIKKGSRIGKGACAIVHFATEQYHAKGQVDATQVALKMSCFHPREVNEPDYIKKYEDQFYNILYEYEVLRKIEDECKKRIAEGGVQESDKDLKNLPIVRMNGGVIVPRLASFWISLEHLPGGNLRDYINSEHRFTIVDMEKMAKDFLIALDFLKGLNIIHRDLKPENCMFNAQGVLKIADFGSSVISDLCGNEFGVQNATCRSPEVIGEIPYTCAMDMFNVGSMLYEFYSKQPLVKRYSAEYVEGEEKNFDFNVSEVMQHAVILGRTPQSFLDKIPKNSWGESVYKTALEELNLDSDYPRDPVMLKLSRETNYEVARFNKKLTHKGIALIDRRNKFFSVIKKMLAIDPDNRLTPEEGLLLFN
jgi:serine/threonine protein kinase